LYIFVKNLPRFVRKLDCSHKLTFCLLLCIIYHLLQPCHPIQIAAIQALVSEYADKETTALRKGFAEKRKIMIESLTKMGIRCSTKLSNGTFYIWATVENLPSSLNNGRAFFEHALKYKVVTVPGEFFEIKAGRKTENKQSPYHNWVRFSFGPPKANVIDGLKRLQQMIDDAKQ